MPKRETSAGTKAPQDGARRVGLPPGLDEDMIAAFLRGEGRRWLEDTNIIGIGIGEKQRGGIGTGIAAVRFDVTSKLPNPADIIRAGSRPIPDVIDVGGYSLPTDIIKAWPKAQASPPVRRKARLDPVMGGISVGSGSDTGTLGAILWHKASGQRVGLSNWHVLANDPDGALFQPGPGDVGGQRNPVGRLKDKELNIDLDAAIMTIQGRAVRDEIAGLGVPVTGIRRPEPNMPVAKSGKESEITYGRVADPNKLTSYYVFGRPSWHDIMVCVIEPDPGRPFAGQLSLDGDSGACWMFVKDGRFTGEMIGLHVAGDAGQQLAYACHADKLFTRFGLEPVGARPLFAAPPALLASTGTGPALHRVTARDGLLLRSGPGREFPDQGSLAFGTEVSVISRHGDWLVVDLQGDGRADGFMHGALLKPIDSA